MKRSPFMNRLLASTGVPVVGIGCLLLATGCEEAPPPSEEIRVVDTVRLEVPGRASFASLSDEVALRSPRGMLWDGAHLFVSDRGSGSVLVVDADGRLVRTLGRAGAGPGEFLRPEGLWATDGELVVLDGGNGRLSRWDVEEGRLLEEVDFVPDPGVDGTVAWAEGHGFVIPSAVSELHLLGIVGPGGDPGGLPGWPDRPRTYPIPIRSDQVAQGPDRTVVLDNLGARLLVGDGAGAYAFERALPGVFVDSIMEFLEARRSPNDATPLLPQFGRFLGVDPDGMAILVLIRPVGGVVALGIDPERGEATAIEIAEGALAHGAAFSEITGLLRLGDCYLVASSAVVQELCARGGGGR